MINLLTTDYKKTIAFEYRWRLIAVSCVLITILSVIAILFLVPSYLFVLTKKSAAATDLANAEQALNTGSDKNVQSEASALATKLKILSSHPGSPSIADIMTELAGVRINGITITGIGISGGSPETISLTGQAADRQSLLLFDEALKQHSAFSNVNLPINELVKNTNLSYEITFTYGK